MLRREKTSLWEKENYSVVSHYFFTLDRACLNSSCLLYASIQQFCNAITGSTAGAGPPRTQRVNDQHSPDHKTVRTPSNLFTKVLRHPP